MVKTVPDGSREAMLPFFSATHPAREQTNRGKNNILNARFIIGYLVAVYQFSVAVFCGRRGDLCFQWSAVIDAATVLNPQGNITRLPVSADSYAADRKSTRLNSSHLGISYAV